MLTSHAFDVCAAPALVVEYVSPAPAVYIAPRLVFEHNFTASAVHAALAPVLECISPKFRRSEHVVATVWVEEVQYCLCLNDVAMFRTLKACRSSVLQCSNSVIATAAHKASLFLLKRQKALMRCSSSFIATASQVVGGICACVVEYTSRALAVSYVAAYAVRWS